MNFMVNTSKIIITVLWIIWFSVRLWLRFSDRIFWLQFWVPLFDSCLSWTTPLRKVDLRYLDFHDQMSNVPRFCTMVLLWSKNDRFMVNPKQLVTLSHWLLWTLFTSLWSLYHLISTWKLGQHECNKTNNISTVSFIQCPVRGIHNSWRKIAFRGGNLRCIHQQSQSQSHLNSAFGDITLVVYPWETWPVMSTWKSQYIVEKPFVGSIILNHHLSTQRFLTFRKDTHIHITSLLSKNLGSQINFPTNKKWYLLTKNSPWSLLEQISIFGKLRTFGTSKKQQRLGNHTTVGAAKVGGGGSCPGCTITPTTSEVLDEKMEL